MYTYVSTCPPGISLTIDNHKHPTKTVRQFGDFPAFECLEGCSKLVSIPSWLFLAPKSLGNELNPLKSHPISHLLGVHSNASQGVYPMINPKLLINVFFWHLIDVSSKPGVGFKIALALTSSWYHKPFLSQFKNKSLWISILPNRQAREERRGSLRLGRPLRHLARQDDGTMGNDGMGPRQLVHRSFLVV